VYGPKRGLPAIVAAALLAVALLGYLVGHRSSPGGADTTGPDRPRVISVGSALVEYPAAWRAVNSAPTVTGLVLTHPVVLAPPSAKAGEGLLAGQLAGGEPAPLPATFLTRLRGLPRAEIVDLPGLQAYRYSGLNTADHPATFELYVIPDPPAGPIALGCFGGSSAATIVLECQQIATHVSLVGQAQYDLTPDSGYASRLGSLISRLDRERLTIRKSLGAGAPVATVHSLAVTLATRFDAAAAALAALEPPLVVATAQHTLAASLRAAHDAYARLGAAASGEGEATMVEAQSTVEQAEAAVDRALANFSLLGYVSAGRRGS
jgi:hypothetical protein